MRYTNGTTKQSRRNASNIGSVSHGTMRPEDLIPDFISCLEDQKPLRRAHQKLITEINKRMEEKVEASHVYRSSLTYFEDGDADSDLESLFDALNEYAPPYFYFGAHQGDGSDYGFWLSESFDQDIRDNDGLKVECTSEQTRSNRQ